MKTKVTKQMLRTMGACSDGYKYWVDQNKPDLFDFINQCIKDSHSGWANWLIVRCMDRKQYIRYAVYAAKQCLPNYEKVYPDDKRVRDAIKAAEKVIKNDTKENRSAAERARSAAWSAANVARRAAWSAANVARSAAAWSAANAARSAAAAKSEAAAAWSAAAAASAASAESAEQIKILRYGMQIMKQTKPGRK